MPPEGAQEYVKGAVPPETFTVAEPVAEPWQLALVTFSTGIAAASVHEGAFNVREQIEPRTLRSLGATALIPKVALPDVGEFVRKYVTFWAFVPHVIVGIAFTA